MKAKQPLLALLLLAACAPQPRTVPTPATVVQPALIPLPASVKLDASQTFAIDSFTTVYVDQTADSVVGGVGDYLVAMLRPAIKYGTMRSTPADSARINVIRLTLDQSNASLGDEGYDLAITPASVTIAAPTAAGLFHGVQTVRQLLPASVEHPAAVGRKLRLPAGHITDTPRYEWRGMMLDVSRHFLAPKDVERFIDMLALYKMNRLHLHLSDDQGWRIEIKSRPSLVAIGGSSQVGGAPGGYYTQDQYRDLVSYAASRFITVVPEIDMPGHTNAALASVRELNCDKVSPPLYTGIRVGFSALCVDSTAIYPVIEDIVTEISSLTPGPYFHIGGDEVTKLTHPQYLAFIERMQGIVNANGKRMIGWGEISPANISTSTIVQNWKKDSSFVHAARGGRVILSPATRVYLDQQYDTTTILGLHWAAYSSIRNSYDWDPSTFLPAVPATAVLGVEAPLWSETLIKVEDFEFMAFPRLIAVSEIGWTAQPSRNWEDFSRRLGIQSARLRALGINANF
ncbi:MAG TPA: beta-N-acetylhexosaminidase [Gemmatimonadaceae bacterium]|nr:beta-N-acetylhexosaminidase [Gemmatimonadaceae bacterium]